MHNPRGSNNRLNERSANRNNGDRMFDSQNNNRGGYNKGDRTDNAAGADYEQTYDMVHYMSDQGVSTNNKKSMLGFEWTNQHGCGGNEAGDPWKLNCEVVLQYTCIDENAQDGTRLDCGFECFVPVPNNVNCVFTIGGQNNCPVVELHEQALCESNKNAQGVSYKWLPAQYYDAYNCPHKCTVTAGTTLGPEVASQEDCTTQGGTWSTTVATQTGARFKGDKLRDGLTTDRQQFTNPNNGALSPADDYTRKAGDIRTDRGLHESWEYYDSCYRRERNRGIFVADQNLNNNNLGYSSAVYTRQNPNNNRRGYECPEERDHFPYWHPSPWKDIAIMTDRLDLCAFYQSESQNVKGKDMCFNTAACPNCIRYNNQAQCAGNNGRWTTVPAHYVAAPECIQTPWSRVNHLGNGRHGQPLSYNWTLPYVGTTKQKCVVRLRYNISTDDYDAWRVNASFNQNNGAGIRSPVQQNPNVDIGADNTALRLAINTAQFGRTFQDRSHVFRLIPRPAAAVTKYRPAKIANGLADDFFGNCSTLYNLNVRGKRGNIVETFPAVEYDFYPNQLHLTTDDCVHVQWTGSNTHNNGNPAGDGQAGDAGEGRGGTDRHNFVEIGGEFDTSFPLPAERQAMMYQITDAYDVGGYYSGTSATTGQDFICDCTTMTTAAQKSECWSSVKDNWALRMATSGYYDSFDCLSTATNTGANKAVNGTTTQINNLLDNAYASFQGGIFKFKKGTYQYMCTRNNNFSNRDQKGKLLVA